jgi:hypothetical protein
MPGCGIDRCSIDLVHPPEVVGLHRVPNIRLIADGDLQLDPYQFKAH